MLSNILAIVFVFAGAWGLGSSPGAQAKLEAALVDYFGRDCRVEAIPLGLTKSDLAELDARGIRLRNANTLALWSINTGNKLQGYAFVNDVKGKARNITYAVIFDPEGEIQGIEILKYRESHGGEISSEMFRKQFAGKTASDPLAVGRDIRNISGATISCHSVTGGVKSLAGLLRYLITSKKLAHK